MADSTERRPIRPVILAGGAGTRLWPLSTSAKPKHLLSLLGEKSLFEQTLDRFGEQFAAPIIVANQAQEADLRALGASAAAIILEPCKRDSAAAIALAAAWADEDELLLICPSDHHIGDVAAFHTAIEIARDAAEAGRLVTFGIEPDHPATGFGYIAAGGGDGQLRPVDRFVEKPPLEKAQQMIAAGGYYWNAGIFLGSAKTWRAELAAYVPAILDAAQAALDRSERDGAVARVEEQAFANAPAKSIDYAVMEHSNRVSVVPVSMGWSDIGSWQALVDASDKDEAGNAIPAGVLALDCKDTLIRTSGPKVAAIGVEGLVIVATAEAVLVMRPEEAQRVREAASWFEGST
ncbi:sugar phosphate nucleotidyltransferase [Sphingomonas sp. NSE70-1]|uniref:Sugar phosphate nucleotidyltransferase n=1 Tax=Sphingomonas caseinilyticus TaxID=2908205 RepID=A0ABT0RTF6_9SPHN|nr:sugar phosphate nucleotidyltransferase [Sphingomonas caseinilyticus]MCL6698260.1 sugar phosphate nucleotidyltransferase [Sphingomonas caseinilyticus]